jgi:hypothetical protein
VGHQRRPCPVEPWQPCRAGRSGNRPQP